jgi:uncharacterized membrane protein
MITGWDIYWITRLDGINGTLSVFVALAVTALICTALFYGMWINTGYLTNDDKNTHWGWYKKWLISLSFLIIALSLLVTFIPTTKEAAAIYLIPKIANNEQVQKLPDNAMKFLNGKLEEWVSEFDEKKGEK